MSQNEDICNVKRSHTPISFSLEALPGNSILALMPEVAEALILTPALPPLPGHTSPEACTIDYSNQSQGPTMAKYGILLVGVILASNAGSGMNTATVSFGPFFISAPKDNFGCRYIVNETSASIFNAENTGSSMFRSQPLTSDLSGLRASTVIIDFPGALAFQ